MKTKSSHQKEEIFMKRDKIMKSRKNAILHYSCCKTRSQEEVQKPKRKKKKPEMESNKNQYFVWPVAKHEFLIAFTKKEKGSKKQYFIWPVAKYEVPPASASETNLVKKAIFRLTCCKTWFWMKKSFFWKMELLK